VTKPRDNQRSAVYKWERSLDAWPGEHLSLHECRWWVHRVWLDYIPGDPPPKIKDGRGRRSGYGNRYVIKLPREARYELYVLHEVAHAIVHYRDRLRRTCAGHGPEYARLVLDLYSRYKGVSLSEGRRLGVHQRPRRVRFATRARMEELSLKRLPRFRGHT